MQLTRHPTLGLLLVGGLSFCLPLSAQGASDETACLGGPLQKSSYATTWQNTYPNSQSLNHVVNGTGRSCQLCHRDSSGGDPWNAYGWAQFQLMDGGMTFTEAIVALEPTNSDGDPTASSNLVETTSGVQPGWTPGANNTIFFDGGGQQAGQLPPALILGPLDPVTYPTLVMNGTGVNPLILTDGGGDPNVSPKIGSPAEPLAFSLDCSGALAPSIYGILVQAGPKAVPLGTKFGELLCDNPIYAKFQGAHGQGTVNTAPLTIPYDLALVGLPYCVQGFCGDPVGGGYLSNALSQTIGI